MREGGNNNQCKICCIEYKFQLESDFVYYKYIRAIDCSAIFAPLFARYQYAALVCSHQPPASIARSINRKHIEKPIRSPRANKKYLYALYNSRARNMNVIFSAFAPRNCAQSSTPKEKKKLNEEERNDNAFAPTLNSTTSSPHRYTYITVRNAPQAI